MPPKKKIKTIELKPFSEMTEDEKQDLTRKDYGTLIDATLDILEPHYLGLFYEILESEFDRKAKWVYYKKSDLKEILDLVDFTLDEQLVEQAHVEALGWEPIEGKDARSIFTEQPFRIKGVNEDISRFYKVIKTITDEGNEGQPWTDVKIFVKHTETSKYRIIQISSNYLDTEEDFTERLEEILSGNYGGSDRWKGSDADEWKIDYTRLNFKQVGIFGNGSSDKMIFEVENIKTTKNDCVYQVLERIGISTDLPKLNHLENLIEFLNESSVSILLNSFSLKESLTVLFSNNKVKVKQGKDLLILTELKNENISLQFAKGDELSKHTILLDIENKHYDLIKGQIKLKPNLFIDAKFNTYELIEGKYKLLLTPAKVEKNKIKKHSQTQLTYCVFDYETIINEKNKITPYSISYCFYDYNTETPIEKCKTVIGFNCNDKFIEDIKLFTLHSKIVFCGFKNSVFDNFLLINYLLEHKESGLEVSDIFYNNNSILNAKINKIHSFFDLGNHLQGSLLSNCVSFGLNKDETKLSFNHNLAQDLYEDGKLLEYIKDNQELINYNERDIISTASLIFKYKKVLSKLPLLNGTFSELHELPTIGSIAMRLFKKHCQSKKLEIPKFTQDLLPLYNKLVKSKIAGRVELFNGAKVINDVMVSYDVCSLYPYVMTILDCYYPIGEIDYYAKYNQNLKNLMGFWVCDIDQTILVKSNLPLIIPLKNKEGNDWEAGVIQSKITLDTNIIILLEKFGCKVKRYDGWVCNNKIKSVDLFGYNLDLMKLKNEQDDLKKAKDLSYNPSLRETTKLLMNSGSGKMLEQLHQEITVEIRNALDFLEIQKSGENIETYGVSESTFVKYKVPQYKVLEKAKDLKFTYAIGCFIYSYARGYMYENSYAKIGKDKLIYTDTDATKLTLENAKDWLAFASSALVPHWEEVEKIDPRYKTHKLYEADSKVFGSFEDELNELNSAFEEKQEKPAFFVLQKKAWFYGTTKINKYRFKGVNPKNSFIITEKDGLTKKLKSGKYSLIKKASEIFKWSLKNENRLVENNPINLFKELYENKEVLVLTSSFRKNIKDNSLTRHYMVKNCKIV